MFLVACRGVIAVSIDLRCAMGIEQREIKFMSLNVNSFGNPVKRAKVMPKLGKRHKLIS